MAHAGSDHTPVERRSDRRGTDRREKQQDFTGPDRRGAERRSLRDRRGN